MIVCALCKSGDFIICIFLCLMFERLMGYFAKNKKYNGSFVQISFKFEIHKGHFVEIISQTTLIKEMVWLLELETTIRNTLSTKVYENRSICAYLSSRRWLPKIIERLPRRYGKEDLSVSDCCSSLEYIFVHKFRFTRIDVVKKRSAHYLHCPQSQ